MLILGSGKVGNYSRPETKPEPAREKIIIDSMVFILKNIPPSCRLPNHDRQQRIDQSDACLRTSSQQPGAYFLTKARKFLNNVTSSWSLT
jgi:hypothetical protein